MPSAEVGPTEEPTIFDRLVRAADAALSRSSVEDVTIDAVAAAAGLSRATAFRQLGKRDDMVAAVALMRSTDYARACIDGMNRYPGTFEQIEEAFRFLARKIPTDPVIRAFLATRTAAGFDSDVHDLATATLGPALERGRLVGEIRTDVPMTDIITWTVEQLYLAMQQTDRSDKAIGERVRSFLTPALAPRLRADDALRLRLDVVSAALDEARQALTVLRDGLTSAVPD
jgi:AcrR family transcriptional regulator